MRVPIYPFDLSKKNRRFKRIANMLCIRWPVPDAIRLMSAQDVLAQGLGYRDFHELSRFSEVCPLDAPVPTLAEVRDSVCTAIFQFSKTNLSVGLDHAAIERLAMELPLHELLAFKNLRQNQARKVATDSLNPISEQAFASLVSAASVVETPRDRVFCALALLGWRQSELLTLKVKDVQTGSCTTHSSRSRPAQLSTWSPPAVLSGELVQYIRAVGLQPGDYLFCSSKGSKHQMSVHEFRKVLRTWASKAAVAPAGISFSKLRRAVLVSALRAHLRGVSDGRISRIIAGIPEAMMAYYQGKSKDK